MLEVYDRFGCVGGALRASRTGYRLPLAFAAGFLVLGSFLEADSEGPVQAGVTDKVFSEEQAKKMLADHSQRQRELMLNRGDGEQVDLGKARKLMEEKRLLLKQLESLQAKHREKEMEKKTFQSGVIKMPALPARLAEIEREFEAMDRSAPWVARPNLKGDDFVRAWFVWQEDNKERWKKIAGVRSRLAGNKTFLERFNEMIVGLPTGAGKSFLMEARQIGEMSGAAVLGEALVNPDSELSQLRRAKMKQISEAQKKINRVGRKSLPQQDESK